MLNRFAVSILLSALTAWPAATLAEADWITKSNAYTQKVLALDAKYTPENASYYGADEYDTAIMDLKSGLYERSQADSEKVLEELKAALPTESDARVKQDLQILINVVADQIESTRLNHDLMLPYFSMNENVFQGVRLVLDARNSKERQERAVTRLKRYAGMVDGLQPITELAKARTEERFTDARLVGPYVEEVRQSLENTQRYMDGIAQMFKEDKLSGWEAAQKKLTAQMRDYDAWVKKEVLPRARQDNRLPEPIYADNLKQFGVTEDPRQLMQEATFGFVQLRNQMQQVAKQIADEQHLPSSDYRDVLAALKKKQISGDAILPLYRERLKSLEEIIRQHHIVTLPSREANIRLASEAESAMVPAPHMNPPRLIGNNGEFGEFVLPLNNPNAKPGEVMDDFTNEGNAWTLTAHEARPGHELQFSAMVENGVSLARAIYAFNSANVEGWGLYSEAEVLPYLPLDGQLFGLQSQMLRAARAFLDPMLNLGLIKPDAAQKFLVEQAGFSQPMAKQEVDRYTFRAPGQATSYYFGFMNLQSMRLETEIALGPKFNQQAFHDFILKQGLLPPALLKKAIMEDFVPSQSGATAVAARGDAPAS